MVDFSDWKIRYLFSVYFAVFAAIFVGGFTDPRDVNAINTLFASLGYPALAGWIPIGGDPCGYSWLGVQCVNSNITGLALAGLNLGGELSDLGLFPSIIQIDVSNNNIGGIIPSSLPVTIRSLLLSGNHLTGSIPDTLSSLGQLTDLTLSNNNLTGAIPDAFQQLGSLMNMDLSGNALTGQLPASMVNLVSLATLYIEDNQLTGVLDVLQDLPLRELNVENNLFSGPIPPKLFTIPNFRQAGNPFNTTVLPSPPAAPPGLPPSEAPSSHSAPGKGANRPPPFHLPRTGTTEKTKTTSKVSWIAIVGLLAVVLVASGVCFFLFRCFRKRQKGGKMAKNRLEIGAYSLPNEPQKQEQSFQRPHYPIQKEPKDLVTHSAVGAGHRKTLSLTKDKEDHAIDMTGLNHPQWPKRPPSLTLLPSERIMADPTFSPMTSTVAGPNRVESANFFTIATLQEHTNSFSQENLVGRGMLGAVYRAESPDGKVLAVKKLDMKSARHFSDKEFLDLVSKISKLRHENIVELVGYCMEHGQNLLVYDYCKNGTLSEALHLDDEITDSLSWTARMHIALQTAKALEYLHEACEPPIFHQNIKSTNILLNDKLAAQVSDCGLAPLLPSSSMTQLQALGYGGPELEVGSYTCQSDVYSFGVVMLELLTGRKAYDRLRPRAEQFLIRWAIPQLHDIDALSRMVDPSLRGSYPSKSLSRLADIISLCIQPEPEFRPPMSEIVQKLINMIQRDM